METLSSILAWDSRSLMGYSPGVAKESDTTLQLNKNSKAKSRIPSHVWVENSPAEDTKRIENQKSN